jgi:hypothetical protein
MFHLILFPKHSHISSRLTMAPKYEHYFRRQKCRLVSFILNESNDIYILPKCLSLIIFIGVELGTL